MSSSNFKHLKKLMVMRNDITHAGMDCLLESKFFANLEYFDIQDNEIGNDGA